MSIRSRKKKNQNKKTRNKKGEEKPHDIEATESLMDVVGVFDGTLIGLNWAVMRTRTRGVSCYPPHRTMFEYIDYIYIYIERERDVAAAAFY